MLDTILFDLDGTLLWMDLDKFIYNYFNLINEKFNDVNQLVGKATQAGVMEMIKNDGSMTNEKRFWNVFSKYIEIDDEILKRFDDLYVNEFQNLIKCTTLNPLADKAIKVLKEKGYNIAICTNPLYPQIATHSRIKWGGMDINDIDLVTTYEDSSYAKPNLKYYEEVLNKLGKSADQCLMVGNDVIEDLCVKELGVKTYLVVDNLINRNNSEIITDYQSEFKDFYEFVLDLPSLV